MDLSTTYLGLALKSPLVASASPLCEEIGKIRQMEDAGAGAVVLHSLFEEQILMDSNELDRALSASAESYAESLSYFPDQGSYKIGPEAYLEHIAKAKAAVKIPVIASLNGFSAGGWISYAKKMAQAGADALELNIYNVPTDIETEAAKVEQAYVDLARQVVTSVSIPVAVKLPPYFTATANVAHRLDQAGVKGLVMFNRFYQPDFDLEALEVAPCLHLSTSYEVLLRLHWIAILFGKVKADLALTGGVHTSQDVLKAMMAGARVAMMTSVLLQKGIGRLAEMKAEVTAWLEEHDYESLRQMQGSMSQRSVANPNAFLRANYLKVLNSYALKG